MIHLAVDAMGGDFAPGEIVAGAVAGAHDDDLAVTLVGDPAAVREALSRHPTAGLALDIVPAGEAIRMDEDPVQAVQSRPELSINVCCRLVLEGRADGVISMGHTGAGMVAGLFNFGRLPGVDRPAFIVPLLGLHDNLFLIDVGGNTDVRPPHLLQFARMGAAYARHAAGLAQPRVGLLANGAEANKGNRVTKAAYPLLASAPGLNFVGNVEGHSLLTGAADVIVSDGFTGNVLLKALEGAIPALILQAGEVLAALPPDSGAIVRAHLDLLRQRNHYSRYGAAALLGVEHPLLIGHGRSKAVAMRNGLHTAKKMILGDVVGEIRAAMAAGLAA
ncbi:MAG: phosphate acyltransferase PlsX [Chloroflexi bacterium]|nr:phosphate acyltransferase PlsX [Chloroflexota bacterium]